jgi:hypothetical protein
MNADMPAPLQFTPAGLSPIKRAGTALLLLLKEHAPKEVNSMELKLSVHYLTIKDENSGEEFVCRTVRTSS